MTLLTVTFSLAGLGDPVANLGLPTAQKNGATGYSGTVTTDVGAGTLHHVVTTSATKPSAAQVKAGQDHAGSPAPAGGSAPVPAAGLRSVSGSGLVPETTYHVHYLQATSGGDSVVSTSGGFTTDAQGAGSGTVTITLDTGMATAIAPYYAHFRIGVTGASVAEPAGPGPYDPTHNDLVYVTTFGDPGAASDKVVNLPAVWNDLNTAYGKHPAHVFTEPGNYTVTTHVYELDGTFVGSDTLEVVVQDPDLVCTGARTILVDPDGQGDAAHPGATVVTSISAALSALDAQTQYSRVLLRRGKIFEMSNGISLTNAYPNARFGAYGTGAKPVWRPSASNSLAGTPATENVGRFIYLPGSCNYDVVFEGIRFEGRWNTENRTGNGYNCITWDYGNSQRQLLVTDCEFTGWFQTLAAIGAASTPPHRFCIHNTLATNWQDYGSTCRGPRASSPSSATISRRTRSRTSSPRAPGRRPSTGTARCGSRNAAWPTSPATTSSRPRAGPARRTGFPRISRA
jgi:hypothetical protein